MAELPFTLLFVAKLNSTGLVKDGLTRDAPDPEVRLEDCLLNADDVDDAVTDSPFLANLFLMESRSIILLTVFWPCCSLARYLFITSGVLATAAVVLDEYFVSSGVLALPVLARPSLGMSRLVPSLLGVSLASLGLFLTLATAASTWALRAALLGVITRVTRSRGDEMLAKAMYDRTCYKLTHLIVAASQHFLTWEAALVPVWGWSWS